MSSASRSSTSSASSGSSAAAPVHGFVVVRGRGYRPDQVDAYADALSADRDAAWERAARLTVLAKHMEAEAEALREAVAQLGEQTYESLGQGARRLYELGRQEADAVRDRARREARRTTEGARTGAEAVL
ncbi:cellulose-binding protein, partial [Streptomyces sp. SID5998]|nr:cellulose-binding protein [Streptomyces sp. SID5998]